MIEGIKHMARTLNISGYQSVRLSTVQVGQQVKLIGNLKGEFAIGVFQGWFNNGKPSTKPEGTMKSWPVGTEAHYAATALNGDDLGTIVLEVVAGMPGALFVRKTVTTPATETTPESTVTTFDRVTAHASSEDVAAMRKARLEAIEAKKAAAIKAEIEAHYAKKAKAKKGKAPKAETAPEVEEVTETATV